MNYQKQTQKKSLINTICALRAAPKYSHKRNPVSFFLLSMQVYW